MLRIFLTLTLLFSSNLFAQSVDKVKGNKALLILNSKKYSVGTELVTMTVDGRKVGVVRIVQVKNDRAIADIIKGTVAAGMTLAPKGAPKKRFADEPSPSEGDEENTPRNSNGYGVLFGFSLDSMSLTTTTTTTFSGSSIKLKGFYDYLWSEKFTLRFAGGLDGFNVKSSTGTLGIQYLSLDGGAEWNFYKKKNSKAYLDAGFSYQIPSSSSNNIGIAASNNSVIFFGGGMNIPVGGSGYLPFYAHYNYIIPSTGITLYSIEFGIGYGWN